jgi:hypothetical protein
LSNDNAAYCCSNKLNWRNQNNASGLYSIHIRIKINESSRYYTIDTPQKVRMEEWAGRDDAWVNQTHPFAFEINNKIIEKKNIINNLIKRCYNFNKTISFEMILPAPEKKRRCQFFFRFHAGIRQQTARETLLIF